MLYPLVYWHSDPARRFWWFVQGDFVTLNRLAGSWAGSPTFIESACKAANRSSFLCATRSD